MAKKKAAKPKTAKKAVKAAKATAKVAAKKPAAKAKAATAKPAAKKAEAVKAKPQTLSKTPAKDTTKKATAKKARKGRIKSVATLKRAGLLRGKAASKRNAPSSAPEKLVEAQLEKLALKWEALFAKASQIPSESYSMRKTFESQTGLKHKTLGWGFIIDNKNDRLEVLFKDGIRYLISNYK